MWVLGRLKNNNTTTQHWYSLACAFVAGYGRPGLWMWVVVFLLLQHPSSLYEIIRRGIVCCFGHFKLLLLEGKGVFVVVCSWNTHMMSIGSLDVKTSTYLHLHLLLFCCLRLEITVSTRHLRHRPFRTLASKQSETVYKIRAQCNRAFRFFSFFSFFFLVSF